MVAGAIWVPGPIFSADMYAVLERNTNILYIFLLISYIYLPIFVENSTLTSNVEWENGQPLDLSYSSVFCCLYSKNDHACAIVIFCNSTDFYI